MSDINLLPTELRKREEREQARLTQAKQSSAYSQPSVLEQRLLEAEAAKVSWWSKIMNWFNKYPEPEVVTDQLPVSTKIVKQKPNILVPEFKPKVESKFGTWLKNILDARNKLKSKVQVAPEKLKILAPQPPASELAKIFKPPLAEPLSHHDESKKIKLEAEVPIGVVLDVNLLPITSQPSQVGFYVKKLLVVAGGSVILVAMLYAVIYTLINRQEVEVKKVQENARLLVEKIDAKKIQYDELELVSRKMKAIKQVAGQRNDWLKFFNELQKITLPKVSFSTLQAAGSGEITLQAQAFTVADLAKQLKSFQEADDMITSVVIGSISVNEDAEAKQITVGTTFRLQLVSGWLVSNK
ncbi:MAG: hypothetical protein V1712_04060 [Patescibacteria group bacterium]